MMEKKCVRYVISGRVQGVFFRDSTQKKAKELNLTGWVRNLPDGRVEVLACGSSEKLEALQAWLKVGPPAAKVTDVTAEEIAWEEHLSFEILA